MSSVIVEDVSLFFADRMIFDSLSLRLGATDRIGLIGPNGSGKTTLLKVIAGNQEVDDGKVTKARGIRVGYLPQDLAISAGKTLIDMIMSSVPGRSKLQAELAEAEAALEGAQHGGGDDEAANEAMMEQVTAITELHERIDHFDRFFGEVQTLVALVTRRYHLLLIPPLQLSQADACHFRDVAGRELLVGQPRINPNLFCFEHKKPIAFPPAKVDSSIVRNWR